MYDSFYGITMKTKTNKTIYLEMGAVAPKWTFDIQETCLFETREQAQKFCVEWFRNFKDYKIVEIKVNNISLNLHI